MESPSEVAGHPRGAHSPWQGLLLDPGADGAMCQQKDDGQTDLDDLLEHVLNHKDHHMGQSPMMMSQKDDDKKKSAADELAQLEELSDSFMASRGFEFDDSRQGKMDLSAKDVDLSELNLFTLHIDPMTDSLLTVDLLPFFGVDSTREGMDGLALPQETAPAASSVPEVPQVESNESSNVSTKPLPSEPPPIAAPSDKDTKGIDVMQISNHIAKLLTVKGASVSKGSPNGGKTLEGKLKSAKDPPNNTIATILISTDRAKNLTQIVISTSQGEQTFKVKSTELMKAALGLEKAQGRAEDAGKKILVKSEDGEAAGDGTAEEEEGAENGDSNEGDEEMSTDEIIPKKTRDECAEEDFASIDHSTISGLEYSEESFTFVKNSTGQRYWVCPEGPCTKMYPKQHMLKAHANAHNKKPYQCDFEGCYWSFHTYFKLKRHMETHLKKKEFICPVAGCNRSFTTVYNLNSHKKLHLRPADMVCPVETCSARFQTRRDLEIHMRRHDNLEAPYKCPAEGCDKTYFTMNSLQSHCRSHQHKEEEVKCQWVGCGKVFDRPCRLRAHLHSHTGDRPYSCEFEGCMWSFTSASKLRRHQRKHTNERRHECSVEGCGKSFLRADHLKGHMLTHMGVRNFQCPVDDCGARFTAKSSLYVHLKKHGNNSEKVTYHCPVEQCIRKYMCKASLRQHMLKFHTPILSTSPIHLDYIALLTTDEEAVIPQETLGSAPGENHAESETITLNGADQSSFNFNTGCDLSLTDKNGLVSPSDYISDNVGYHHLLGNGHLPSGVAEVPLAAEAPHNEPDKSLSAKSDSEAKKSGLLSSTVPDSLNPEVLPMEEIVEPVFLDVETLCDSCPTTPSASANSMGAARTDLTFNDILSERARKKQHLVQKVAPQMEMSPTKSPFLCEPSSHGLAGVGVSSDVVLTSGVVTCQEPIPPSVPIHNNILTDDLPSSQDLYPSDHLMTLAGGPSEFQVLLLSDPNSSRDDFPESTINLRDLE